MGLFEEIKEFGRQIKTGDDKFYRKFLFFFELEIPPRLAASPTGNKFVFPLVINPDSYSLSEPFSVEISPTTGGGLYVEENGIIWRDIRIEGHTGFKPRDMRRQPSGLLAKLPNGRSYSRALPPQVLEKISGHRHFMYLQDAVFRTYADLKNDPATAAETKLYFHVPKDEEHWLVVPRKFDLTRTKDKRILYPYSIELLAVSKAEESYADFSEDLDLLSRMKKAVRMVKDGIARIEGAINDLTALVGEIVQFAKDIVGIIDTVRGVVDAANNFLGGITNLIQVPYAAVEAVIGVIAANLEIIVTAQDLDRTARTFPQQVEQRMRSLQDGLEILATQPQAFETDLAKQMRKVKDRQSVATSVSQDTLDGALATPPPATFDEVNALGTAITQGEAIAADAQNVVGQGIQAYTSSIQVKIGQGDTLVNLAARYLGDARLWQHIATLNGLKPPFTLEDADAPIGTENSGLAGTLTRGEKILIPSFDKPPTGLPLLPVLGVRSDESAEAHILGTDLRMDPVGTRVGSEVFDFVVDVEGGSQDFRKVTGIACLSQGLRTRVSTERGFDILYKQLGMERVIGLGNAVLDAETLRFRASDALNQDPRVAAIRRLEITVVADKVELDTDVEIRGFSETVPVTTEL